ncbi:hypothetical protein SAMN05216187_1215 [Jeotgalicoccus aerolatus]|uniref:Uncharacterized protein n=1 Tax=Jeotgalicoccus aerolatus TaxID=709510 RepID=A0A1G9ET05_9STAP|nr:hypothetical protein SAMN05216187_1215 [Jeotgalicoccus aerolatus]
MQFIAKNNNDFMETPNRPINGKEESILTLNSIIRKSNFNDEDSVINMVNNILKVITEDKRKANKK